MMADTVDPDHNVGLDYCVQSSLFKRARWVGTYRASEKCVIVKEFITNTSEQGGLGALSPLVTPRLYPLVPKRFWAKKCGRFRAKINMLHEQI